MAHDLYRLVPSLNLSTSLVSMEHFRGQQLQDAVLCSQKLATFKLLKEGGVATPFSEYCFDHPRMKLDLFCKQCEADMCRECTTTRHRRHEYTASSDKIHEEIRRLGEAGDSIEEMLEEMKRAISGVKEVKQRVRNRKDNNINVTRKVFATLRKAIDEREEQTITDIEEEAYKREKALELQLERLVLVSTQLKNCLDLIKNINGGKMRAEELTKRRMILEQRSDHLKEMKKKSKLQPVTSEQAESECENIEQLLKVLNKLPFIPLDPSKCGYYKISIIADGHRIQSSQVRTITMSSLGIRDFVPSSCNWVNQNQPSPSKEMIKKFRAHTKDAILCLSNVKKKEHQSGAPFIKVEWCGIQCSGKYGHFTYNLGPGRLDNSKHSSVVQSSANMVCSLSSSMYKSQVTDPNAAAYPIDRLEEILVGNKTEVKWLSKMRHENIITLLGVFYEDGSGNILPMLVMESIHCDLKHYLLNNAAESAFWNEDLTILQGISSGLVYLHEVHSIIHNRISIKSIMLTKDLVVKLSNLECSVKIDKHTDKSVFSQSSDILLFGKVISDILCLKYIHTHTEDDESMKQLMQSLFEWCTTTQLHSRPTSCEILQALKDHKIGQVQKTKIEILDELKRFKAKYQEVDQQLTTMIQEKEENRFHLTNSFTTVDSRSPKTLSEEYTCIQLHDRLAAARAHKKAHVGCDPVPFHQHTMIAFTRAKELAFAAFDQYLEQSLFQLQEEGGHTAGDYDVLNVFRLMLNTFYEKHNLAVKPTETISKALSEAYAKHVGTDDVVIPDQVKEYYGKLAEFTWTSITKAIPMILSMEKTQFDDKIHELKDDPEDDNHDCLLSAANITYVYPTLFVSNKWPREVATKGKVTIV